MLCEKCQGQTCVIYINDNHEKLCSDCYNGMKLNNFKMSEFACKCCGEVKMDEEFLQRLDSARQRVPAKFIIESGYRCPKHNQAVHSKSTSSHIKGLAADIRAVGSRYRFWITQGLILEGFTRIGEGDTFIHVDLDRQKPPMVKWRY
jgi:hypothetical protein